MAKKIKICFVNLFAYPLFNPQVKKTFGGAELDMYLLAIELAKEPDYEVSFIVQDHGQPEIENIKGVKVIKADLNRSSLAASISLWKALKAANADIYFRESETMPTFITAFFCKLHKKKFVFRSPCTGVCDGTFISTNKLKGKLYKWSLRNAVAIIGQNQSDIIGLQKTIGVSGIVIANAHDLNTVRCNNKETILWVGRYASVKQPNLFLKLAEKFPKEKFVMISPTDKQYEKDFLDLVGSLPNLEFIPYVEFYQIDKYFNQAKLFVNTSISEGYPNTFVQACKNYTPILSLNVNPDNFLTEQKCGFCANGDWETFLEQFITLNESDLNVQYQDNARKYAETRHDMKPILQQYKSLFYCIPNLPKKCNE